MSIDILTSHPCFNKEASKIHGRIHLPVAKKCNISCNYCNRKYDCMNESRPGVTSEVLSPEEAFERLVMAKKLKPYLSTLGIAGPGDSLANPDKTFETLELVNKEFPDFNLCLSTNGLMLPDFVDELIEHNVRYVTVTINTVNPYVAQNIYRRVRFRGETYRGIDGARLLLERQQEGVAKLKDKNVFIKINCLLIPGINDLKEIEETAHTIKDLGAHLVNVMPLIPAPGSLLQDNRAPLEEELNEVRSAIGSDIAIMSHCRQCRSDAVGLLGEDSCTKSVEEMSCGPVEKMEVC